MKSLTMESQLTLRPLFERAGRLFSNRPIVWRRPDRTVARHTYAEFQARTGQLANALSRLRLEARGRIAPPAAPPPAPAGGGPRPRTPPPPPGRDPPPPPGGRPPPSRSPGSSCTP